MKIHREMKLKITAGSKPKKAGNEESVGKLFSELDLRNALNVVETGDLENPFAMASALKEGEGFTDRVSTLARQIRNIKFQGFNSKLDAVFTGEVVLDWALSEHDERQWEGSNIYVQRIDGTLVANF